MIDYEFVMQPLIWSGNPTVTTSEGTFSIEHLADKANSKIKELHKLGAHVSQMTTFTEDGVVWAYLYFERAVKA